MKIWRMDVDFNEFETLQLEGKDKLIPTEIKTKLRRGIELNHIIDNMRVEILDGIEPTDCVMFWSETSILVFSKEAVCVLNNILDESVEIIPLDCDDREYFILNVLSIIDAIDYTKSNFRKLDTGLVVGFDKYSFLEDEVKDKHIFKVLLNNKVYTTEIFVSETLKNIVEEHKLKGFKFIEVWDSEKDS